MSGRKQRKGGVTFQDDPLRNLLFQLDVVSKRLQRFPELVRRLELERAPITAEKYLIRLRGQKKELIKKILKIDPPRVRERPISAKTLRNPSDSTAWPIPYEEWFYRQFLPAPQVVGYITVYSPYHKGPKEPVCPVYAGYAEPLRWGDANVEGCSINHDSTVNFGIDDHPFLETGCVIVRQELDDDASIWRDDNPDYYIDGFEVVWELPKPACAVTVKCSIDILHHFDFTNGADDGGGFKTSVCMVNSDKNGEFEPVQVSEGIQIQLLNTTNSGTYDSRTLLEKEFRARKRATIRVALGHFLCLWAQDGLVEALGTIGTYNPDSAILRTPHLKYVMIPIE